LSLSLLVNLRTGAVRTLGSDLSLKNELLNSAAHEGQGH
jgi:hypothetical protein